MGKVVEGRPNRESSNFQAEVWPRRATSSTRNEREAFGGSYHMADQKIYRASTTAPVNIAVIKYTPDFLPLTDFEQALTGRF